MHQSGQRVVPKIEAARALRSRIKLGDTTVPIARDDAKLRRGELETNQGMSESCCGVGPRIEISERITLHLEHVACPETTPACR